MKLFAKGGELRLGLLRIPKPAMRQEAATTGSWTTNIFNFSITAIFDFVLPFSLPISLLQFRIFYLLCVFVFLYFSFSILHCWTYNSGPSFSV